MINMIRMSKSRRMRWAVHAACKGGKQNAYNVGWVQSQSSPCGIYDGPSGAGAGASPSSCACYIGKNSNQLLGLIDSYSIL
jgi:hypothetical protein